MHTGNAPDYTGKNVSRILSFFLLVGLSLSLQAADKKRKAPKPPDLEILSATAQRSEGKIAVDCRVRNTGQKPIAGLILLFDFMADGRAVITTQKGPVEEEMLEPGKEATFRLGLNDPVRAVAFQIQAVDEEGRDLRVANQGPFPIE